METMIAVRILTCPSLFVRVRGLNGRLRYYFVFGGVSSFGVFAGIGFRPSRHAHGDMIVMFRTPTEERNAHGYVARCSPGMKTCFFGDAVVIAVAKV